MRLYTRSFSNQRPKSLLSYDAEDSQSSVLKDLFDYEGATESFRKSNEELRNQKLQGVVEDHEPLRLALGKNFERHAETVYRLQGSDSLGRYESYTEYNAATKLHPKISQQHRVFRDEVQLRNMRALESQGWQGVKESYPSAVRYPMTDLQRLYKPDDLCGNLSNNQLAIFNIPLDVNEVEALECLSQVVPLESLRIHLCKLSLNSYAVVDLPSTTSLVEAQQQIRAFRYKGCILDVLSNEDKQDAWDRTIVLLNLEPTMSYQEVIHWASQFGRVHNALIPLMQRNPDLPTEEQLVQALENDPTLKYPAKLVVYDVENNRVERKLWPSESEYMEHNRGNSSFNHPPHIDKDNQSQQDGALDREINQRMFFLRSEREYSCLRIPGHLKEEFNQLWVPSDKQQSQLEQFYSKEYLNLGYALITYPTTLLAQRALYNITARSSNDLSFLQLPMHNQPPFYDLIPDPHTSQERYGHRFTTERLALGEWDTTPDAIKAWKGMELYHVDAKYMLHQFERYRREAVGAVEGIRQAINQENTPSLQPNQAFLDKQQELRQRIFRELSEPENAKLFDEMVKSDSFSQQPGQFEEKFTTQLSNKAGRQFNANFSETDYEKQVEELVNLSTQQQSKQERYVQDLINRNQKENIEDRLIQQRKIVPQIENDPILREMQSRLSTKYAKQQEVRDEMWENLQSGVERADKLIDDDDDRAEGLERRISDSIARKKERDDRKAAKELASKPQSEFSTISHPVQLSEFQEKMRSEQKLDAFHKELKTMMFGTYSAQQKEQLFSQGKEVYDLHTYAQMFSQDISGRPYLNTETIEIIREFDLPVNEQQRLRVRKQEFNRKYLLSQLPKEALLKLSKEMQSNLTDSIIANHDIGTPTESYEINSGQDGKKLSQELNMLVARRGETFHHEVDQMTKKEYIIKSEKPFYKYDLEVISEFDDIDDSAQLILILKEQKGLTQQQAEIIVKTSIETGEIHPLIIELFQEAQQQVEDVDIEQAVGELKISKKQLEYHLTNDILNEEELFQTEIEQQMAIESLRLKFGEINKDTVLKQGPPEIKLKNPSGKYKIPKYRNL